MMTKASEIVKGNAPRAIVLRMVALTLMAGLVLGACAGEDDNRLEITGSYNDNFGGSHEITQSTWTQDFGGRAVFILTITSFTNSEDYLVGENEDGTFSRIDWTVFNSDLYFCTTAFAQATADDAEAAGEGVADKTDPSAGGCGIFTWSRLDPVTP